MLARRTVLRILKGRNNDVFNRSRWCGTVRWPVRARSSICPPRGLSEVFTDSSTERADRAAEAAAAVRAGTVPWQLRGAADSPTSTPSRSSPSAGPTDRWWCRRCGPASTSTPPCRWPSPRTEIADIIEAVRETGLTYMMGETSYYNPATVFARKKHAEGAFGRIFYAEGDYVHDMDLGFYDAYQYSGGEDWKRHRQLPAHALPDPLRSAGCSEQPARHAVSVSCVGVRDERGDGVFDRTSACSATTSPTPAPCSNSTGGGSMRINELRRVGYPSHIRESPLPLLRHRGQLRTARHGQRVAGQAPACHDIS